MPRPVGRFPPSSGPSRRPPRAPNDVREIEDRTVVAPDREVVGVAVRDRARRVHHLRSHDAADDAQALARGDRQPGREAGRRRRDRPCPSTVIEQAALADEVLQVLRRRSSRGRDACRRSDPPIRGSASPAVFFHGSGLPHIGMPLTIAFGAAADRRKDDHVVLRVEVVVARDLLRADVGVRHLRVVERLAPPAFGLRAQPGVQHRDARRAHRMRLHRRRGATRDDLQTEIGRRRLQVGRGDVPDDERAAIELLAARLRTALPPLRTTRP